jgi:hypothetical protein
MGTEAGDGSGQLSCGQDETDEQKRDDQRPLQSVQPVQVTHDHRAEQRHPGCQGGRRAARTAVRLSLSERPW